jgi:hypothetical protein
VHVDGYALLAQQGSSKGDDYEQGKQTWTTIIQQTQHMETYIAKGILWHVRSISTPSPIEAGDLVKGEADSTSPPEHESVSTCRKQLERERQQQIFNCDIQSLPGTREI